MKNCNCVLLYNCDNINEKEVNINIIVKYKLNIISIYVYMVNALIKNHNHLCFAIADRKSDH